jgi:hypothetical protein
VSLRAKERIEREMTRCFPHLEIIAIFPVGSSSWNCLTAHDEDWVVLVKGLSGEHIKIRRYLYGIDYWIIAFEESLNASPLGGCWACCKYFYNNSDTINISWINMKDQMIKEGYSLLLISLAQGLSSKAHSYIEKKHQTYCYLNYYTCLKDSFDLTEDELAQVQKVHDRPGATLEELIELKNNYEKHFSDILFDF